MLQLEPSPTLQCFRFSYCPCLPSRRPALLLIHGWACNSAIWSDVIPGLERHFDVYCFDLPGSGINVEIDCDSPSEFLALYDRYIHSCMPSKYVVLGWSLGGVIASLIADRHRASIRALMTVATSPTFVAKDGLAAAVNTSVFDEFSEHLAKNSHRVMSRFRALQVQGVAEAKSELRWLNQQVKGVEFSERGLDRGLSWLKTQDLRDCWGALTIPVFHHYGFFDSVVPATVAEQVEIDFPKHDVTIYQQSSHLPFHTEQKQWLSDVIASLSVELDKDDLIVPEIDKRAVSRAFSKAAKQYDSLAEFQIATGKELIAAMSDFEQIKQGSVLDLGSGTGFFARSYLYDDSAVVDLETADLNIVELDIAAGMLSYSQKKLRELNDSVNGSEQQHYFLQADMEDLPFAKESFDLVFSNLSIQWCHDTKKLLKNIHVALKSKGIFVFTTVLDGSLKEIQQAWGDVDQARHVNRFKTEQELQALIENTGWKKRVWGCELKKECFDSIESLLASVKGIGAGNHIKRRDVGLLGKNRYNQWLNVLSEQTANKDGYELSYNVLTVVIEKVEDCGSC